MDIKFKHEDIMSFTKYISHVPLYWTMQRSIHRQVVLTLVSGPNWMMFSMFLGVVDRHAPDCEVGQAQERTPKQFLVRT